MVTGTRLNITLHVLCLSCRACTRLVTSQGVLTAQELLVAVTAFVHRAVEGLVDCLVFWLVTNTGLPAPGLAFGLIASAHKTSVPPRIGLLIGTVLTLPVKHTANLINSNATEWTRVQVGKLGADTAH